jgi:uncharacterized protein (DUF3820 family)
MIIITALLEVAPSAAQTGAVLKEMSLQKEGTRLNVQVKIDGTYTVEASFLPEPPRLVVDLTPISQIMVLPYTQINDIGVLDIRTSQNKPNTARLVFNFSQNFPAYSLVQNAEGLKVSFWYEGEVPPIQAPIKAPVQAEPIKPIEQMAPAPKVVPAVAAPEEFETAGRSDFFVAARAGMAFFMGSDLSAKKTRDLYGETATLDEAYSFSTVPVYEIQFGKYFGRTKVGLGASYYSIKQKGAFTASLPHPFLEGTFRSVAFNGSQINWTWEFSVSALFSIMDTEKIGLYAGPILGLAMGSLRSLEEFNFTEEAPYAAANITITDLTYAKEKFTEMSLGALLNIEYRLNEGLSLLFDLRAVYLNPKNASLGKRANLLHLQPLLGIQYNF